MKTVDLNADIGEADTPDWAEAERNILRYISSANIACGGHAGDAQTMRSTVRAAIANDVIIGAHPAYPDRENFGRRSLVLGVDIETEPLKRSLTAQITALVDIAAQEGAAVAYVKPHGALYNDAVSNRALAALIVEVVAALDSGLSLMGGPNSEMQAAAQARNLGFIPEGFIDRRYTDAGHLQSRAIDGAVITDQAARMAQARALVTSGTVITASGSELRIAARSLCLHGDSAGAVETARLARGTIEAAGVTIAPFAAPL